MGDEMTIEEAMKTAIEYEIRIRDIYLEAVAAVDGMAGKRILKHSPKMNSTMLIIWNTNLCSFKRPVLSNTGNWHPPFQIERALSRKPTRSNH